jgi:hypothetical protein
MTYARIIAFDVGTVKTIGSKGGTAGSFAAAGIDLALGDPPTLSPISPPKKSPTRSTTRSHAVAQDWIQTAVEGGTPIVLMAEAPMWAALSDPGTDFETPRFPLEQTLHRSWH